MIIHYTDSFKKDFQVLPATIQKIAEQKICFLVENERHSSLHIKKMQGSSTIWEGRITIHYRFTFDREQDSIRLRRIGTHDILRTP